MDTFLNSITDGVIILDDEWQFLFANERGAELLNKNREQLLGENVWQVCAQDFSNTFFSECHRAVRQQIPLHWQEFCTGLNLWLDVHAYPSQQGLIVLFQDVTAFKQNENPSSAEADELENQVLRKILSISTANVSLKNLVDKKLEAETSLQNTNAQLASVLESVTDGIITLDENWCYVYVNKKAEHILKKDQSELLGRNIWQIFPSAIYTSLYQHCQQASQSKTPIQFEDYYPYLNLWLEHNVYPTNNHTSIYFRDITKRKLIENEFQQLLIREQNARIIAEAAEHRCNFLSEISFVLANSLDFQTTLAAAIHSIVPFLGDYCLIQKLESDGKFYHVAALHRLPQKQELINQLSQRYSDCALNGNSLTSRVMRTQKPVFVTHCSEELAKSITTDTKLLEIFRELNTKSCLVAPLIARGQIFGILFLGTAESDRRYNQNDASLALDWSCRAAIAIDNALLYQKAQESNRLKDEFLANLSHELRTPLNSIWGWTQILARQHFENKNFRKAVDIIERKVRDLTQIVNDILDVSSILTGNLYLNLDWVDLCVLTEEMIESLNSTASAKSIQIHTDFDRSLHPIQGDEDRLRQIVWNLLSNAIKFTSSQGNIYVRLFGSEHSLHLEISDDGVGIRSNFIPYIFDRFRQADGSKTRSHGGLGLGLSLVKSLVEMHRGTVEIKSAGEGKGTTAAITMPKQKYLPNNLGQ